jgi:hypothetical protein
MRAMCGKSVQATATQVADRPDLRPLRAVDPHRLAPQAAGSAIELARCLPGLVSSSAAGSAGVPASGSVSALVSSEPIAADRSRHGDHHRDIVNVVWDYDRTNPMLRAYLE